MLKRLIDYWDLTQAVGETVDIHKVRRVVRRILGAEWAISTFETSKDEVVQVYNSDTCYTVVGGSSADKYEWKSNFNAFPLKDGMIHNGFYINAMEIVNDRRFVKRENMYGACHSRGAAIWSVLCYIYGWKGVGFGTPKAFRKIVSVVGFVNVNNCFDPVCHVVPFFKTVGNVVKVNFTKNPHTKYGKKLKGIKI